MNKQAIYVQTIQNAYPDLAIETVQFNQSGQFNDILLVNDALIFRFPKVERETRKLRTEVALLRSLQARLSLPIPQPLYVREETEGIGQIFMGYPMLPGKPLRPSLLHTLGNEVVQSLAEALAIFLRQLHSTPLETLEVKLPDIQGCAEWSDLYQRFRDRLFPFMRDEARLQVVKGFEDFLRDEQNYHYTPALIHGDFGPSNILYDPNTSSISGILDFSSMHWGDPAVDIASLLCSISYGEAFLERFSVHYLGIEALLPRARFYASTFALQEALYGVEDGDQAAFESGIASYR